MYEMLRKSIDEVWIIDDHGHPGITLVNDRTPIPKQDKIPFRDGFRSPAASSSGFRYIADAHYEAYEKLYGWSREYLDDPKNEEEIRRVYEEKRLNVRTFIDEVMAAARVEHLMGNMSIPQELEGKNSISLVPGLDGLLFPLDNSCMHNRQFSRQYLLEFEYAASLLKARYGAPPDEFTAQEWISFVDRVLEGMKGSGVPAVKIAAAYVRSLYFPNVDLLCPEEMLKNSRAGCSDAYYNFQSYIFWHIMRKLGELELPVQIHTAVTDSFGDYFDPQNLGNLLKDKACYKTKIVLLHAGFPNYESALRLALWANVGLTPNQIYIDISGRIMFGQHPRMLAKELAKMLAHPVLRKKVLYGSDVLLGERYIYTAAKAGRDAVYFSLAELLDEGILASEEEAVAVAKDVLRNNAIRLYQLPYELA